MKFPWLFIRSKIQFFESKSQHGINLTILDKVVYQIKDTIFWKQITTTGVSLPSAPMLFIRSKIQFFESKSQPKFTVSPASFSCLSDQRYNFLKANHNSLLQYPVRFVVVYQIKDTIFWKQITTFHNIFVFNCWLFIRSKIQFFESKSQLTCTVSGISPVVYQIKDTIFWKQITTHKKEVDNRLELFIRSKIQFFESKSQLKTMWGYGNGSCLSDQRYNFLKANHNCHFDFDFLPLVVYQIKDTIFWKQITTILEKYRKKYMLFIRSKIQFFESKSQQLHEHDPPACCCLSDQRYNFLKANHNCQNMHPNFRLVVYQIKDTIFWKQITTFVPSLTPTSCCLSDQRYNFLKANHNSEPKNDSLCLLFIRSKIQFFESKSQQMVRIVTM